MSNHTIEFYEARARIAKALAHPSRLLVLDALLDHEMCVNDLTDLVGADQSTVSKHLGVLREAGLVGVKKEGTMSFYRLNCRCLEGFFSCLDTVLRENVKVQQAALAR